MCNDVGINLLGRPLRKIRVFPHVLSNYQTVYWHKFTWKSCAVSTSHVSVDSAVCVDLWKGPMQLLINNNNNNNNNNYVAMPLHNGQVGSLPPSGRPPTRQVSPAGYMFPCSPYGDQ